MFQRLVVSLVAVVVALAALSGCPTAVVNLPAGQVVGLTLPGEKAVEVFRGIPYAAPPVGELRWKPPVPTAPWEGTLQAYEFGSRCVQEGLGINMSEDCLYLNVWRPAGATEALPVMVWIHGGGYDSGAGSFIAYDGTQFARQDVILVTINYRLGPLGFMAHPGLSAESPVDSSGNYGLLDQIAALRWVQENIGGFGGDPNNVTIFGESAGAFSVSCLLVSPQAEGLFHRAILQSGVAGRLDDLREETPPASSAEQDGLALAQALGVEGAGAQAVAALRAIDARIVAGASIEPQDGDPALLDDQPNIDGWVLPGQPIAQLRAGAYHRVPILAGTNAEEGTLFVLGLSRLTASDYTDLIVDLFGNMAQDVLTIYPPLETNNRAQAAQLVTDLVFIAPTRLLMRAVSGFQAEAYCYHFTRRPSGIAGNIAGPTHAIEIPYVFNNLPGVPGLVPADRALARTMQDYWVAFARTGNPNGSGRPFWPAYDETSDAHLRLDVEIGADAGLRQKECDLLEPLILEGLGL